MRKSYLPYGVVATIEDALIHYGNEDHEDGYLEDAVPELADRIADSLYAAGHLKEPS